MRARESRSPRATPRRAAPSEAAALEAGAEATLWVKTDLLDPDQVERLVTRVTTELGKIDVLVNNVGGHVDVKPFWETTAEQCRRELDLTLRTTLDCTRAVLPGMIARGTGRIVNVGSTSGIVGDPLMAAYSAAKGAVVHTFTKVLAKEVGRHGITVNAVAPFATRARRPGDRAQRRQPLAAVDGPRRAADQGVGQGRHPGSRQDSRRRPPRPLVPPSRRGRRGDRLPRRHSSRFITGHVLVLDGGMTLVT